MTPELAKHMEKVTGKLNVQGLARREPLLMRAIKPDPGYTTVSIDLCAGEPSLTSHFSQDKNYMYACFDGVGKAPFYQNGVLMIDDIYLMVASVAPIFKKAIRDAFDAPWPAGTFAQQWLADAEVIKGKLKKIRQQSKVLALGIGYSMGPKKMVKSAYDMGFELSLADAKAFYKAYWQLFAGVRRLSDKLTRIVERDKRLVNPFGYRLTPEAHKSFNFFIQSSVSGVIHVFSAKLMAAAPWVRWVTLVHDELIIDCPIDRLEEFREATRKATESLNADLQWSVAIRTGFVSGTSWYEAK